MKPKFRVWSKKLNCWLNHCAVIDCQGNVGSHSYERYEDGRLLERVIGLPEIDVEIQQFTGLKDKNGREIYEGDIVKQMTSKGIENSYVVELLDEAKEIIRPILWAEYCDGEFSDNIECWMFGDRDSLSKLLNPSRYQGNFVTEFEIVGNIFENKELL